MLKIIRLVSLLVIPAIAIPYTLRAQSTIPPSEVVDGERKKVTITISKDQERLIQDYLDVLKYLKALMNDYRSYFSTISTEQTSDYLEDLNFIMNELQGGTYLEHFERLSSDIKALQESIKAKEEALKESDKKAFRLSLSFREELEEVKLLLQEDIVLQMEAHQESLESVKAYLKATKRASMAEDAERQDYFIVATISNGDSVILSSAHKGKAPNIVLESVLSVPSVPEPHKVTTTTRDFEFICRSGTSRVVKEIVDSIYVSSSTQPIYINNPIGNLEVTGWDRGKVLVLAEVELSTDSRTKAREYAQQIALQLYPKGDGVGIELTLPNFTNLEINVIKCALEVKVPKHNPLVCTNSFGEVLISRIHNGVKLTADNSQVEIDGVEGRTEVTNNMGEIHLLRITGPIKVTNSYSPIEIIQCRGNMEIENAFSSIELSQTEGDVVIRNSGRIDIMRHTGTIQIENKYGQVEVMKLDGDLTVQNSFQSLSIEDIFGSAEVKNTNGDIEARNVQGEFTASNSFGRIYGYLLYGPIHLASYNGSIEVTLAEKLAGPSTIDISFGPVKVFLSPHSDLLLMATAVGGDIQSHFPINVDEVGSTKTAELALGNGKTSLTVSASNATVIIGEAR